ncbi:MAG: dihydroxyacetone kinase subunit L [Clostridiales bacterium]|nr:dihydroxyacetone kinase subunit L [Clostridiales bacterium]
MDKITTDGLRMALLCAARQIIKSEPYLTEIDTIIGDGDHGSGMKTGFSALEELLMGQQFQSPYELLHASGLCLVRTMGGASGVLFGTLFIGGLDQLQHTDWVTAQELVSFLEKGVKAIQTRGRAGPGDKTMLDALLPAAKAMTDELERSGDISGILREAHLAALEGVEKTKAMLPRTGRSKNFREKAIGYPDPGAISVSILLQGLSEGVEQFSRGE